MNRRTFLTAVTGGLLAAPLAVEGQPAGKTYQVGIVHPGGPYYTMIDGLKDGLKELGFEEGTGAGGKDAGAGEGRFDLLAFDLDHLGREARNDERSNRVLRRNRSRGRRFGEELCQAWRQDHRRPLADDRAGRQASPAHEGDAPKAPSHCGVL